MEKPWLDAYPKGTPAEIDADAYPSLVAMFEESCRRFAQRPALSSRPALDCVRRLCKVR